MGRQERIERIKYLDGIARFFEWVSAALVVGILTGGVLLEDSARAAGVVILGLLLAGVAALRAYRVRAVMEEMWGEVLREDPGWVARSPLVLILMAAIAAAGVLILRLVLG